MLSESKFSTQPFNNTVGVGDGSLTKAVDITTDAEVSTEIEEVDITDTEADIELILVVDSTDVRSIEV